MASTATSVSDSRNWVSLIERFILIALVALGGMTIVTASWARDFASPRVTLLGTERGISLLITTGSTRVLVLAGSNPTELGNAIAKARHPGLDRIDLMIVSGNPAATELAQRSIQLLHPRMILAVGSDASLRSSGIVPGKLIDHTTEIDLPNGVVLTIEVWSSEGGDGDDVTWSVMIERGGAAVYWVADREALLQEELPDSANITIMGRGSPAKDTPFPRSRVIVAAGESISGPDLRATALDALGPETETARIYAGEITRIELDPQGIHSMDGTTMARSPIPS